MAQSPTERITALERIVDVLTNRVDGLDRAVITVNDTQSESAKSIADLHREFDRETALLKREVEALMKEKEEWGRKLWMILPPILAVLVSNALTLLITLYLKK